MQLRVTHPADQVCRSWQSLAAGVFGCQQVQIKVHAQQASSSNTHWATMANTARASHKLSSDLTKPACCMQPPNVENPTWK